MSRRTAFRNIELVSTGGNARIECIAQSDDRLLIGTDSGKLLQYQLNCSSEGTPTRPAEYTTRQLSNEAISKKKIEQIEKVGDRLVVLGGKLKMSLYLLSPLICASFVSTRWASHCP